MTTIYKLVDATSGRVGYVGKTRLPLAKRLQDHLSDKSKTHKTNWIKSLALSPIIVAIESCDDSVWREREKNWIAYYKLAGENITNSTAGGDGPETYDKSIRLKISKSLKGKKCPCSPERAMAISVAKKGKSNGLVGIPKSTETKRKISEANTGRESPTKGLRQPQWLIDKRIKSRMLGAGFATSEETKRKISERSPHNKPVRNAASGIVYRSIAEASRSSGIPESTVRLHCKIGKFSFV